MFPVCTQRRLTPFFSSLLGIGGCRFLIGYIARLMTERFDHAAIDARWQRRWEKERVAYVDTASPGDKFYMLNMFPYPSASRLHVGHGRNYILGDALYRRERMAGRKALNPMGWDAFGLPAENAAIASGVHPREYTLSTIARLK